MKHVIRLALPLMLLSSFTPATALAAGFSASGSASPAAVVPGGSVTIALAVRNTSRTRTTATIVATVYRPNGAVATAFRWANRTFAGNGSLSFSVRWTTPTNAPTGTYRVGIKIQNAAGTSTYLSNANLTSFAVGSTTPPTGGFLRGVNLAGAEFGDEHLPGTYDEDYIYPNAQELDYYKGKGLTLIRLCFRWERMQHSLNGALDSVELSRMDSVVAAARQRGMKIIIDPHNFGRYYGGSIGSSSVPNSAFADFWRKLADHYRNEPAVWAYGLMTEPHDMGSNMRWSAAAQAAVNAIRQVDMNHPILVPGDGWSAAMEWPQNNGGLNISDPANNLYYEAHQYFDNDNSGTYDQSYDAEGAYPTIGVDRLQPFLTWLTQHHARGFLGEYGVPDDDARWLTVLDNFLSELDRHGIGGAYWAGGPWWDDYRLSVEPRNGNDRPQMSILVKHPGS